MSLLLLLRSVVPGQAHPEYFGDGLSFDWWVGEVARLSQ